VSSIGVIRAVVVLMLAVRVAAAEAEESYGCVDLTVGPHAERAKLCTVVEEVSRDTGDTPVDRVLLHRKLRVVRAKKTVTLLDVVETISVLDKMTPTSPDVLNLKLVVARDGLSATLSDAKRGASCHGALAGSAGSAAWDRFDRELETRACAARGRWVWSGTTFVRVKPIRRSP
jgi:hypothetical protein